MDRTGSALRGPKKEVGQVIPMVAVMMVGLLGVAALAVDLGYLYVTRNELQNVADAGALAGTRALGNIYQNIPYEEQVGYVCDDTCPTIVKKAATDVVEMNQAGGLSMTVLVDEVIIGQWDGDNFTKTNISPDAVHVIARRDEVINGPVSTFFARVLGIDEASVTAEATAALTGQGTSGEGKLLFPVTLSKWFFEAGPDRCDDYIRFHPTDETSCGGWTTWDEKSNANLMRDILEGDDISPEMSVNEDRIWTTGGTLGEAVFPEMMWLFAEMGCASTDGDPIGRKYLTEGDTNGDGCVDWKEAVENGKTESPAVIPFKEEGVQAYYPDLQTGKPDLTAPRYYHMWDTGVPVYSYADAGTDPCANPGGGVQRLIVGFAPVIITDVYLAPDHIIEGRVICEKYTEIPERGGGGNFGIKGTIPGLVR